MCGLFAWSSTRPENWTPLKKFKFELLGVEMDLRGGDGCGVAFDHKVRKSVEIKKFDDFWRTGIVPEVLEKPMIIGHDRKASVGEKSINNTQPICFDFKEDNRVGAILTHNGTLYNHKELYEKHKLEVHYNETDIKTMSDSQVLALLIERVGWTILEEYTGSAAVMFMSDKTPDEFYIYHGKSAMRKFAMSSDERPLFYAIEGEDIWFCSTRAALEKIVANKSAIEEVPYNEVLRVSGNTMTKIATINREKSFQLDDTVVVYSRGRTYAEDDGYDGYGNGGYGRFNPVPSKKAAKDLKLSEDIAFGKYQNMIHWESGLFRVCTGPDPKGTDIGTPCNGLTHVNMNGKMTTEIARAGSSSSLSLYFWHGNLCKGRDEYQECLVIEDAVKEYCSMKALTRVLGGNFVYPFIVPESNGGDDDKVYSNSICTRKSINGKEYDYYNVPYTGSIGPIGRAQKLIFRQGDLSDCYQETYNSFFDLKLYSDAYPEEFVEWMYSFDSMMKKIKGEMVEAEPDLFVCPDCEGSGEHATGKQCLLCKGTGVIDLKMVEIELAHAETDSDTIAVQCEEMKYATIILDLVESGIDILEEPDIAEKSTYVLDKLKKIKTIIKE